MYCPVCFQSTLKVKSHGVIKLEFDGKARATSLFTYNVLKEEHSILLKKFREKTNDYMKYYAQFVHKKPITKITALSSDFECSNRCKIDFINTKVSVIGLLISQDEVTQIANEEAERFKVEINLSFKN